MARLRKKHKRLKKEAIKDPQILRERTVRDIARIEIIALESDYCKGKKKYWERYDVQSDGRDALTNVDALIGEIERLQGIAKISTDEAIQSNIEANMYKNMLGDKEKDMSSVARIMKNSLYKKVRDNE